MLERAQATDNIEFLTPYVVEEFLRRRGRGARPRASCVNAETGEKRELAMNGAFIAIGHEPQSEIVHGHRRDRRERLRHHRGQVDAHEHARACFAAGDLVDHTYRQAVTAAGSGCQAALDAEWYLRDNPQVPTPAALEGTGDLAEAQWAPAAATAEPSRSA